MNTHIFAIAIDRYENWNNLRGAKTGLKKFIKVMKKRFGVKETQIAMYKDNLATAKKIEKRLIRYAKSDAHKLNNDDQLIIYFAGHGEIDPLSGDSFLIPTEADHYATSTWLSYNFFQGYFRAIEARHILMISDACFSGGAFRGDQQQQEPLLKRLHTMPGRHLLTSGGMERVDDSRFKGQSVFSWALNSFLESTDEPVITAQYLADEVQLRTSLN